MGWRVGLGEIILALGLSCISIPWVPSHWQHVGTNVFVPVAFFYQASEAGPNHAVQMSGPA